MNILISGATSEIALKVIESMQGYNFYGLTRDKNLNSNFMMTAHILYKKIDSKNLATFSTYIIKNIIRKKLNFNGILISDDISMKALSSNLCSNADKALNAGCNLVLYCKGNIKESSKLLKNLRYIDNFTKKKTSQFYKLLS